MNINPSSNNNANKQRKLIPTVLPPGPQLVGRGIHGELMSPPKPDEFDLVECIDDKIAAIPKSEAGKLPFSTTPGPKGEHAPFPYSFAVLSALYIWCLKYGSNGVSDAQLPAKTNYIDFSVLIKNHAWEKEFFERYLFIGEDGGPTLIGTMNAAEKYKMEGLLSLAIIAFSCCVRGKEEEQILALFGLEADKATSEAEKQSAKEVYPWLKPILEQ